MMRSFITTQTDGIKEWDEKNTRECETIEEGAGEIIDNFNATLRPGEKPRKIVKVTQIALFDPPHTWGKVNLVTKIDNAGQYDGYKCSVCGATGKRRTLSEHITRDAKFKDKRYEFCIIPKSDALKLSKHDAERYALLKDVLRDGMVVCFAVGAAMREIKERQFYVADGHETWEAFCDAEYGWTKRYCNQLMVSAEAINGLPPSLRKLITSNKAAIEIAKIPEALRLAVVTTATDGGKRSPTAKDVKKASPPLPARKKPTPPRMPPRAKEEPKEQPFLDETGIDVPVEVRDLWRREDEPRQLLNWISSIRTKLASVMENGDSLFAEVDLTDDLSKLDLVFADIKRAVPYAVCPTCQGKMAKGCLLCKGRGFLSKYSWDHLVPQEMKDLRKR